jgi:hypothetical protein
MHDRDPSQVRRDRTRKTGSLGRIERQRAEIGPFDWLMPNLLLGLNCASIFGDHVHVAPVPLHQQVDMVIIGLYGLRYCEMLPGEQDTMSREHHLLCQIDKDDEYYEYIVASHQSLIHLRTFIFMMAEPTTSLSRI